jgi:hypothetical protein
MRRSKRMVIAVVGSALLFAAGAPQSQAQRGRRGASQGSGGTPHSKNISEAMGELEWGMSKKELLDHFTQKIRSQYQPKLAKATGAIEEDRLRHEMNRRIQEVHDSYVRFDGSTTGWDVSFLEGEFTHKNDEAMIVYEDDKARNFYFLIDNKFWKWYRAFNQEVFAGANFRQFSKALQQRFGKAKEKRGTLVEGGDTKHWLEWQDKRTRLRAIDQTQFYGFYCLVFEDKQILDKLDTLRTHQPSKKDDSHSLVESVTSGEGEQADPDENPDIVDRITGKIRNRKDAPEEDEE